ncbi:hypothetical protein HY991_03355 [Candidatus Micrarchaeota archaeon]|nr:hypothetical protein [Candidatus Micrarchaeota archaeon]
MKTTLMLVLFASLLVFGCVWQKEGVTTTSQPTTTAPFTTTTLKATTTSRTVTEMNKIDPSKPRVCKETYMQYREKDYKNPVFLKDINIMALKEKASSKGFRVFSTSANYLALEKNVSEEEIYLINLIYESPSGLMERRIYVFQRGRCDFKDSYLKSQIKAMLQELDIPDAWVDGSKIELVATTTSTTQLLRHTSTTWRLATTTTIERSTDPWKPTNCSENYNSHIGFAEKDYTHPVILKDLNFTALKEKGLAKGFKVIPTIETNAASLEKSVPTNERYQINLYYESTHIFSRILIVYQYGACNLSDAYLKSQAKYLLSELELPTEWVDAAKVGWENFRG